MEATPSPWRTVGQVAEYFQVKPGTVRLWTREGCPLLRAGRLVRFDIADIASLLAWLESRANAKQNGK
jgi:phage terminase Nu1 subunit (DNA packaging protein)